MEEKEVTIGDKKYLIHEFEAEQGLKIFEATQATEKNLLIVSFSTGFSVEDVKKLSFKTFLTLLRESNDLNGIGTNFTSDTRKE